jgi:hypothetical protein
MFLNSVKLNLQVVFEVGGCRDDSGGDLSVEVVDSFRRSFFDRTRFRRSERRLVRLNDAQRHRSKPPILVQRS